MGLKAESTITSWKSRANNLIVLVEVFLKFTSNNGFQLFLDVLLTLRLKKIARIELLFNNEVCTHVHHFFDNFNLF